MLWWYLLTASSSAAIGYMIGARKRVSEIQAMREEIRKQIREQDRRHLRYIDRFNAERLMREADEEFEARHGE